MTGIAVALSSISGQIAAVIRAARAVFMDK
jgi:hypothetical protein